MDRKRVRDSIMAAVNEQLTNNDPLEVKQTLDRLISEGWSKKDAKSLIAQCLIVEIFDLGKYGRPYQHERYIKNLNNLPEEPFDKDEEDDNDFNKDTDHETQNLPTGVKIGRNEKVTVKYLDGRVEEYIKFKKVKDDLLNRLCELID